MRPYTTVALGVASLLAGASAQGAIKCSQDSKCPSSAPCCSSYGQCGVGAYCLGGCDPKSSFDLSSCTAAPTCRGGKLGLKVGTDVIPNTQFLGDASTASWVSSGTPANYGDGSILLTMPASSVGTLLSSTHYVWYGKITAQLATSQGAGVVTAFILMSDMKDEIDFEFIGVDLNNAQSNYYYQGITNYDKMKNLTVSDTRGTIHTYEIDWQPDSLTWSIDGQVMRTVYKKDTYNTTDNSYHYPQSPSRVQLSLWPAGLPTNGKGTVDWSGGLVNWDSQYMQNGYYYAQIKSVNVQCYNPPKGDNNNGNSAYYYTSIAGTQNDVAIGNNDTTLASFYATGDDPKKNPNASGTKSSSSSASPSSEVQTVPGISGGGVRSDGSPSTGSDSEALSGSSGSSDGQTNVIGSTSFSQGLPGSNSAGKVQAGSAIALLGFFIAALML